MTPLDTALLGISTSALVSQITQGNVTNTGKPGAPGRRGRAGPRGANGSPYPSGAASARFFNQANIQEVYVSTTGNDVTGNGVTAETAYATVQRALLDLPMGWTSDARINVAAGTYTGVQAWTLSVLPGAKHDGTANSGRLFIAGTPTVLEALTGGAAGTLNAGKLASYTFNVGTYATTITRGDFFVHTPLTTFAWTAVPIDSGTTPNIVVPGVSTTAFAAAINLSTWGTIFSGAITINVPAFAGTPLQWFTVAGMRFSSTLTARGVNFRGCRHDINMNCTDCTHVSPVYVSGTQFQSGDNQSQNTFSTGIKVAGTISLQGRIGNFTGMIMRGAPSAASCHLAGGGTSTSPLNSTNPTDLNLLLGCDFFSTAASENGIRWVGGSIHSSSAMATFALAGATSIPIHLSSGARVTGNSTTAMTGTGTSPALVEYGSHLDMHAGYGVTNSASAGADVTVGAAGTVAVGVPTTDGTVQLCRYT